MSVLRWIDSLPIQIRGRGRGSVSSSTGSVEMTKALDMSVPTPGDPSADPASSLDERFDKLGRRWIDDVFVAKPSTVPDVLYHYTDAAGLVGMLQNHTIWATDYRFMNDKSEVEYTWAAVRDIVNSKLGSCNKSCANMYREVLKNESSNPNLFIFSLSREKDDLSQWRGYARDGQGFTVGFCGTTLNDTAGPDRDYSLLQVEYDTDKQGSALRKILTAFETELSTIAGNAEVDDPTCEVAASYLDWVIYNRAAANKHQSFLSEREWRLAAFVREESFNATVEIRAGGLSLVRYVELEPRFPGTKILPIKSIGIGPGFVGDEQRDAVETLCSKAGYNVEIYSADTPYRRARI
jgi:hypothetical protein